MNADDKNSKRVARLARRKAVQERMIRISVPVGLWDAVHVELCKTDIDQRLSVAKMLDEQIPLYLLHANAYKSKWIGARVQRSLTLQPAVKDMMISVLGGKIGIVSPFQYTFLATNVLAWWLDGQTPKAETLKRAKNRDWEKEGDWEKDGDDIIPAIDTNCDGEKS